MKKIDVLCLGNVNIDITTTPMLKEIKQDKEVSLDDIEFRLGGNACITSAVASNLGLKTGLIGAVGNDFLAELVLRLLDDNKVFHFLRCYERTGITIAISRTGGKKSLLNYSGANTELRYSDLPKNIINIASHLHCGGYFFSESLIQDYLRILKIVKQSGKTVSFDLGNLYKWKYLMALRKLLPYIDIIFLNEEELKIIGGSKIINKACRNILRKGVKIISLHLGSKGAKAITEKEKVFVPAYKAKVVYPTGPGDAFNAGFIYSFLKKDSLKKTLKFALACSKLYLEGKKVNVKKAEEIIQKN